MLLALYEDENNQTVIWCSNSNVYYIEQPIFEYINMLCVCFGCTYDGRKNAAKYILQIKQKVPILLSEVNRNIIFPTVSSKRKDCIWIHSNAVQSFHKIQKKTKIVFITGEEYIIDAEYRTVKRQMQRCVQLKLYLDTYSFENLL